MATQVTLLYFASVRENVGKSSETVMLPDNIDSVASLMAWLKTQDEGYKIAFDQAQTIKVAVDQEYVDQDFILDQAKEIAFFPPVTGG